MKQTLTACALALALLLPTALASAQTSATQAVVNMVANLTGGEENPAILTGAVGAATLAIDRTNREIAVELRLFNIPTGTTAGHIHVAPRGVNGPVVVDFPIPTGRTGDLTLSFRVGEGQLRPRPEIGINSMDDVIQSVVGGAGYVNIHTSTNPGGEMRGQIVFP